MAPANVADEPQALRKSGDAPSPKLARDAGQRIAPTAPPLRFDHYGLPHHAPLAANQADGAARTDDFRTYGHLPVRRLIRNVSCDVKLYSVLLGWMKILTKPCVCPSVLHGSMRRSGGDREITTGRV
jgi:hypothetical protein